MRATLRGARARKASLSVDSCVRRGRRAKPTAPARSDQATKPGPQTTHRAEGLRSLETPHGRTTHGAPARGISLVLRKVAFYARLRRAGSLKRQPSVDRLFSALAHLRPLRVVLQIAVERSARSIRARPHSTRVIVYRRCPRQV